MPSQKYAANEMLKVHDLMSSTALHTRVIEANMDRIQDSELRQLAEQSLKQKRAFVQKIETIFSH